MHGGKRAFPHTPCYQKPTNSRIAPKKGHIRQRQSMAAGHTYLTGGAAPAGLPVRGLGADAPGCKNRKIYLFCVFRTFLNVFRRLQASTGAGYRGAIGTFSGFIGTFSGLVGHFPGAIHRMDIKSCCPISANVTPFFNVPIARMLSQ